MTRTDWDFKFYTALEFMQKGAIQDLQKNSFKTSCHVIDTAAASDLQFFKTKSEIIFFSNG
jgi:hypothetical protein